MKVMLRPADGTLFPLIADFCNKICHKQTAATPLSLLGCLARLET